jgi:undecaprenyl-diphosphatase
MTIFQAILLGIIQGLTEFLPISSSAHLVFVPALLGWEIPADFNFIFDVLVQMGTLIAVIIYFWRDLIEILSAVIRGIRLKTPFKEPMARLGWLVILATIPAGVIGLLIKPLVESVFSNPTATALMLVVTALILFVSERIATHKRELSDIFWMDAILIGLAQALAIFPGISRSGATISAGLSLNVKRPAAARFSFLMSIPIILATGILEGIDLIGMPDLSTNIPAIITGIIAAAVIGFLAIHWLLGYLAKHSLYVFSIYCLIAAAVVLIILYV